MKRIQAMQQNHTAAQAALHFLRTLALAALPCMAVAQPGPGTNPFGDPVLQLSQAIPQCKPMPAFRPATPDEIRAQAHGRVDRGTTCYRSGRCRLPNAYLYDKEIIPRVQKAVEFDGRFADSSVWVEGQRRWVWLRGCVRGKADKEALEQLVRSLDDVEAVINELELVPRKP